MAICSGMPFWINRLQAERRKSCGMRPRRCGRTTTTFPPKAIQSYRFVADVWRNADAELQPHVAEAREGVKQLVAETH